MNTPFFCDDFSFIAISWAELALARHASATISMTALDRDGASELRTETRPRHLDWLKALYAALPYPHGTRTHPPLTHATSTG